MTLDQRASDSVDCRVRKRAYTGRKLHLGYDHSSKRIFGHRLLSPSNNPALGVILFITLFTENLMGAAAADQFDYAVKVGNVGVSRALHDAELAEEMSEVILAKNGNAFRG